MPDLNKFLSEFKHGFQHSNRFVVQIFVQPTMVANIILQQLGSGLGLGTIDAGVAVTNVVKWLYTGFLASTARLPSRGFGVIDLAMYGITEHFPYHAEFTTFDCTFMMPHTTNILNDNGVPRWFNYWQNQIQNINDGPNSGLDFSFPSNYYATILLTLLDRKDRGTITYQFDKCYPVTVDSSQLSWEQENQFTQLPVSFQFSTWKQLPHVASAAIGVIDTLVNSII